MFTALTTQHNARPGLRAPRQQFPLPAPVAYSAPVAVVRAAVLRQCAVAAEKAGPQRTLKLVGQGGQAWMDHSDDGTGTSMLVKDYVQDVDLEVRMLAAIVLGSKTTSKLAILKCVGSTLTLTPRVFVSTQRSCRASCGR